MQRVSPLLVGITALIIATGATLTVIRAERQDPKKAPAADTAKITPKAAQRVGPGTPDIPGQSTYKGKWVLENGFIKVPDGRRFQAPAGFKRVEPSGQTAEANKNFDEVARVAKEMVAEAKTKKDRQDLVANPEFIKGVQIIKAGQVTKQVGK
jgi:hypothetical protein